MALRADIDRRQFVQILAVLAGMALGVRSSLDQRETTVIPVTDPGTDGSSEQTMELTIEPDTSVSLSTIEVNDYPALLIGGKEGWEIVTEE